jgi:spore coat protein CotF
MPYGAHETMEMHEILMEKINMITHFNLYVKEAKNPQLLDMIIRHQQEEIRSYNEIVDYTRGNHQFSPIPPNTEIRGINHQQIQYGLNNPPQFMPQSDSALNDREIATAMLIGHKNGARNCTWATLECADPNLRRMMLNCAATCTHQAYEVFLFMNEKGVYQVPTLNNQAAETILRSYQPASESLEAQYFGQSRQNAGFGAQSPYGQGGNMMMNGNLSVGSQDSVLYGGGGQNQAGSISMFGNPNTQGSMRQ